MPYYSAEYSDSTRHIPINCYLGRINDFLKGGGTVALREIGKVGKHKL